MGSAIACAAVVVLFQGHVPTEQAIAQGMGALLQAGAGRCVRQRSNACINRLCRRAAPLHVALLMHAQCALKAVKRLLLRWRRTLQARQLKVVVRRVCTRVMRQVSLAPPSPQKFHATLQAV